MSEKLKRNTALPYIHVAGVVAKIVLPDHDMSLGENYRNHREPFNQDTDCDVALSCMSAPPCFDTDRLPFQAGISVQNKFLPRPASYLFMRKQEVLIARQDFSNCRFWYASPDYLTASSPILGDCGWPLLAIWGYLSTHGAGLLLHGALVKIENRYVLVLGASGVGKSTLSRLAVKEGAICLTDENPFLRCHNGLPMVYGSPWYSDAELIPETILSRHEVSGPLAAVFILHHAPGNRIQQLPKAQAGFALLKNTRTFNWLPDTIPDAVSLIDIVARKTPVYSFGFVPDSTSIAFLRKALGKHNEQ